MPTRTRNLLLELVALGAGLWLVGRAARSLRPRYDFKGRVVLITGGSRGLGLETARRLAAEGARLAICARDPEELERARAELEGLGAEVLAHPCDLTKRSQVRGLVRAVEDRYGRVDVLVNNAGIIEVGPVQEMTIGDFEEAMDTNFWAALYTTLAVVPGMRARGEGRIVNVSSIGGKVATPHLVPYSASKFALVGLSGGLRAELARDGIVVTTVCPGEIRTGAQYHATFKGQNRKEFAWFSISDSLPFTSISTASAAKGLIEAARRGEAEVVLGPQAQLLAAAHALSPTLVAEVNALVNRALPGPGGIGQASATGSESTSALAPSVLTALGEREAKKNNELGPIEPAPRER